MPTEESTVEAKSATAATQSTKTSPGVNFSAFVGKVFDQLSLSAWLPAAMLIGNLALLLQLNQNRDLNIERAVQALSSKPLGTIVILVFSLILATLVTQAFEFEIIRLLEGYASSTNRPLSRLADMRIRRHVAKRVRLVERHGDELKDAFKLARQEMLDNSFPPDLVAILSNDMLDRPQPDGLSESVLQAALGLPWQSLVPPHVMYRIDRIDTRLASYPAKSRVLPTRLGNVLRRAEDELPLDPDEDLETFVIRNLDGLPDSLQREHRDYRTRLDMYCCLVLVFGCLAVASVPALYGLSPLWGSGLFSATYVLMVFVSYEAAIASARGYCTALQEIGRRVKVQREPVEEPPVTLSARIRSLFHRNSVN